MGYLWAMINKILLILQRRIEAILFRPSLSCEKQEPKQMLDLVLVSWRAFESPE